jgi:hypothetical protein
VAIAVSAFCVWGSPAWASFPGRDGNLVVATGSGLELVNPATGTTSSICTDAVLCGDPTEPRFSPDGRAIVFVDSGTRRPVVVAADGSCLWCLLGARLTTLTGSEPAFVPGGRAVTVARKGLWSLSLTGGRTRRLVKGPVGGAAWSSRGRVALVRRGWIWVGRPGQGGFRRLARGDSPSFSPDSMRLAFVRDGHVWIVALRGGTERRLVSGTGPVWSPDGRQIAYIGPGGSVEITAVRRGRPHAVGAVHGSALDWQPLPASDSKPCTPPQGATVLASSPQAVVFSQRGSVFSGCLKALGRTRRLLDASPYFYGLLAVRLAGRFAALETEGETQYAVTESATAYDLGSGKATNLATLSYDWNGGPVDGLDFSALDSSGFAAWRETSRPMSPGLRAMSCPSVSLCIGGDGAGNIVSSANPTAGAQAWGLDAVVSGEPILAVSCPSTSLCVASGWNHLLTATDPAGGASAWTSTPTVSSTGVYAISCPSVSLCVAGGAAATAHGAATILTSTDPTRGTSSWSSAPIAPGPGLVGSVSCPSVSLCVATTNTGAVFTSTHPTGGASAWTSATVDRGQYLGAVSCPSVSLCLAIDGSSILTTTNPTGGASAWTKANIDPGTPKIHVGLDAVTCPSVSLCVAGDSAGNILTSTDPAGGASAWTKTRVAPLDQIGNGVPLVSCPSVSLCLAAASDDTLLSSTDPTGGATAWTSAPVDVPGCPGPLTPCMSERLFARDDHGARMIDSAPPGQGDSISNVALNSLELSWTHNGAPRQLELH